MDALQKENTLLKDYVASLQKQNEARNVERSTLFHEIDRMTQEIDRLNALLAKPSSRVIATPNNSSQKQIKILKETNITLTKEIDTLKTTNNRLTIDLRTKTNEVLVLTQEQQRLLSQLKTFKESQNQSSTANNKIILLQSQINSYKIKISQISVLQQNIRISNIKITELETTNRKLESDYKRVENQNKRQQTEIKRLQIQNKELKMNNRASTQMSSLLSSKLNLEATIRQLNSKVEWLESSNKNSEQQKLSLERRIKDLEKEILQAKAKLTQFRFNEQSLKSFEASLSIKDKEMQALQQMIGSLKQNKKYLEKLLRQKQDTIINVESQLTHNKTSNTEQYQRQINQLVQSRGKIQKQLIIKLKANQELEDELRLLKGDRELMQRDISMLGRSLEEAQEQIRILKNRPTQCTITQHQPYFKPIHDSRNNGQDIRLMVSSLKDQIQQLKASQQFKPQSNLSSNGHHYESCQHLHLKSHLQRQSRSPQKHAHSKLIIANERDKSPFNKQKWDSLQRKINVLRTQNEALKKSLFE